MVNTCNWCKISGSHKTGFKSDQAPEGLAFDLSHSSLEKAQEVTWKVTVSGFLKDL